MDEVLRQDGRQAAGLTAKRHRVESLIPRLVRIPDGDIWQHGPLPDRLRLTAP